MSTPSSEEQHDLKKTRMVFVKWMKPPLGWFKLNTDGSSVQQRKVAGGGGVIRDGFGNWVVGFSMVLILEAVSWPSCQRYVMD